MPLIPASELPPGALLACLGLLPIFTAAFCASAARGMPAFQRPLRLWACALLCVSATAAAFAARQRLSGPLAYAVANLAILSAFALVGQSLAALQGGNARRARWNWALVLLAMAVLLGAHVFDAPYGVRATSVALAVGLLALHGAWLFLPQLRERPRALPEVWLLCSLMVVGLTFVLRALPFHGGVWDDRGPRTWSGHPLLVLGLVFVVSSSLAFFTLLHERQRLALLQSYQRDSLTGLYMRGVFFDKARAVLQGANAGDRFAVVMADLDHFKRINDTYGHPVGDKVIAHAARMLHGSTRLNDLAGRYGGEEFCLLLHDCDSERACRFLQRVMGRTEQPLNLRDGRSVPFSFSAGFVVCQVDGRAPPLEDLLERADQALLHAKAQGRNRAVEARGDDMGPAWSPADAQASSTSRTRAASSSMV